MVDDRLLAHNSCKPCHSRQTEYGPHTSSKTLTGRIERVQGKALHLFPDFQQLLYPERLRKPELYQLYGRKHANLIQIYKILVLMSTLRYVYFMLCLLYDFVAIFFQNV